ncbi:MAG: hypothetical protein ACLQFR_20250 [Streptosporangiaceae bacterium]
MLLRPKWLAWHLFAVVATAGMLYLGYWQLRRAESGNELSWAYTFEWPIFAVCGVVFWVKSIREELRLNADVGANNPGDTAEAAATETADAYLARLKAEVQGHGRWHGIR